MTLITDLLAKPASLPVSSRFTVLNGYLYLASGALFLLWPGAAQTLFLERAFVGEEAALVRVIGMALALVGWLYLFGGRSGARQFVAASVIDRITLVPLVLLPLALLGVFPKVMIAFALLDPVLGLSAWYLLRRESKAGRPDPDPGT